MKQIFLGFTISFFILGSSVFAAFAKPLVFVTDDSFPPYSFKKNGEIDGIDIRIVREMAGRLGIEVEIRQVPWKRLLKMTENGLCDGAFSLFRNKDRERYAVYALAKPIHLSRFPVFYKKGKFFKLESIQDLYGKTIGINRGFSVSESFDEAVNQGKIKVNIENEVEDNIFLTVLGKIDGFTNNYAVTKYKMQNNPRLKEVKTILVHTRKSLSDHPNAYLVLSKKAPNIKDKTQMIKRIDKVLSQMNMDGTVQRLFQVFVKDPYYFE